MRDKSLSWTWSSCPRADGLIALHPFLLHFETRNEKDKHRNAFYFLSFSGICKHFALQKGTNVRYYLAAIKVKAFFIGCTECLLKPGCRAKLRTSPKTPQSDPSRQRTNCTGEADLTANKLTNQLNQHFHLLRSTENIKMPGHVFCKRSCCFVQKRSCTRALK